MNAQRSRGENASAQISVAVSPFSFLLPPKAEAKRSMQRRRNMWCTNQRSCIEIIYSIRAPDFRDHRRRLPHPPSSDPLRTPGTCQQTIPGCVTHLDSRIAKENPSPAPPTKLKDEISQGPLYITPTTHDCLKETLHDLREHRHHVLHSRKFSLRDGRTVA